nr:mechanosensitive ion channel family protein [Alkalimarinus sediminis]
MLLFGFVIAKIVSNKGSSFLEERFSIANSLVVKRLVFYGVLTLFLIASLKQMGFELGVLLGAAGVLSVAIGFASQTSMSNIISGMFLLGERAVSVGDSIKVGNTVGEVISIDWLSIKLRTFDNLYVRLPNEAIIKTEMINMSRFKIRRFDLMISVAYQEDLALVKDVLFNLVTKDTACLDDPEPQVIVDGFGDSGVNIRLAVWAKSEEFLKFKSSMNEKVKAAFDNAGIEIPFPHISLYAGEKSLPLEVAVTQRQQTES